VTLLLLFLLGCTGCTEILTQSNLTRPLRALAHRHAPRLGELLSCPMCSGWWVGVAFALAGYWPAGTRAVDQFAAGCAASIACWTLHVVLVRLGSQRL
jgi:hypothetical protein